MKATPTLKKTLSELDRLFKLLNRHFYSNKLEAPIIVVQSKGKHKNALGWCTTQKIWREKSEDENGEKREFYEITITAEFLHLPIDEIIDTLMHEMVHLYNLQRGKRDCSRGNTYHNTTFRDTAIEHGLIVTYNKKHGWNGTELSEDTKKLLTSISIDEDAFRLVRADTDQLRTGGGRQSSRKYICPECGLTVRATKEVNVKCADCDVLMQN
jgi:rubrerythrin